MSRSRSTSSTGTLRVVASKVDTVLRSSEGRIVSIFTGVIDENLLRDLHRQLLEIIQLRGESQDPLLWILNAREMTRFDASVKDRLIEILELASRYFRKELVLIIGQDNSLGTFRAFMMGACMGRMKLHITDSSEEAERVITTL